MSIGRNAGYNFLGALVPVAITIVTLPLYLKVVGPERYGVLALCWVLLGYTSFVELGIGPAVTQKISKMRGGGGDLPAVFWTAAWISGLMAVVGGLALFGMVTFYFTRVANVGGGLIDEAVDAAPLVALIVPLVLFTSLIVGALQAQERFAATNVALGVGSSLAAIFPLVVYLWLPTLSGLAIGTLLGRIAGLLLLTLSFGRLFDVGPPQLPKLQHASSLVRFGSWVALSGAAAPILLSADRLVIGGALGAAAVVIYSIPLGLLTRLNLISSSLASALFPRFGHSTAAERQALAKNALLALAVVMTPFAIAALLAAELLFRFWIGRELANPSLSVAYILLPGVWIGSFTPLLHALLRGAGRPREVAMLFLAEILPYWVLVMIAAAHAGLAGVAFVWGLRSAFHCLVAAHLAGFTFRDFCRLSLPGVLVLSSATIGLLGEGPSRIIAQILLLSCAVGWGAVHAPSSLRIRLHSFLSAIFGHLRRTP